MCEADCNWLVSSVIVVVVVVVIDGSVSFLGRREYQHAST